MADDWGNDPLVTAEAKKAGGDDDWGNDKLVTRTGEFMAGQVEGDRRRWDPVADTKRAAGESIDAWNQNMDNAFITSPEALKERKTIFDDPAGALGREVDRAKSAFMMPLNALGVLASPLTGGARALIGSAASYLPWMTKESADEAVDTSLMGMRPKAPSAATAPKVALPEKPGTTPRSNNALADLVEQREPPAVSRAETAAEREVFRRMESDAKGGGPTAEEILAERAKTPDKPLALSDLAGENARQLTGNVARAPGPGREIVKRAFDARDEAGVERITGDVKAGISDRGTKFANDKALMEARSANARPLYEEAEALELWSPRLQTFLEEPEVKAGLRQGMKLERLEALAENRKFDPAALGVDLDAEGNIAFRGTPNLRVLDAGKRGLDALIAAERNEVTGKLSQQGVALEKVRKAYVNELDTLDTSGVYKKARDAWSGPTQSMDAIKAGRDILKTNPEQIAADFAEMSANDKEFYKLGVADRLIEAIAKKGATADEAKVIIGTPWTKSQLRPLFADEAAFNGFMDNVAAESRMHGTRYDVLGNSKSAARHAEDAHSFMDAAGEAFKAGLSAAHGRFGGFVHGIGRTINALRDLRRSPEVNAEIARLMVEPLVDGPQPSKGMQFLKRYQEYKEAEAARKAQPSNFLLQNQRPPLAPNTAPPIVPPWMLGPTDPRQTGGMP